MVSWPWSNSNVSQSGYNWAVVVRTLRVISAWLNLKWFDLQHVLTSAWLLNFASHSKEAQSKVLEQMLLSTFVISSEFLYLIEIEIIKALYYYISYYFFLYFETLRLTHSVGLTIVNKDVLPSLFLLLLLYDCLRESLKI